MSVAWNCGSKPVPVEPEYTPRWVRAGHMAELVNLYHLSRTALAGDKDEHSKWARMQWASKEFAKAHDYVTSTGAYKDLSNMLWR